jgi:hypothetical protein
MINRIDGSVLDEAHIKMKIAFNVFCGIALDNAKLYRSSLKRPRQLRGFVRLSSALNKTISVVDMLDDIVSNSMMVIHTARGTIFLFAPDTNRLSPFVRIGKNLKYGALFAEASLSEKAPIRFD